MVYKKFKDYKLSVIRMIFLKQTPSEIINYIESLETDNNITPSQVQYLVNMFYEAEIYKMGRPTNISQDLANRLRYETEIMVYRRKIIASYIPSEGRVYLE